MAARERRRHDPDSLICGLAVIHGRQGTDVYLFLGGMMLLAEVGRKEGLFDRPAALTIA